MEEFVDAVVDFGLGGGELAAEGVHFLELFAEVRLPFVGGLGGRERVLLPLEARLQALPEGDEIECPPLLRLLVQLRLRVGAEALGLRRAEARHYDATGRMVFPAEEAKGKRKARVIHLTAREAEFLDKQLAELPAGILFVNKNGLPWNAYSMSNRFDRLKKTLVVKFTTYSIRHAFATRKLVAGHDHLTVAELLGHANGTTLAVKYQYLS